MALEVAMQQPFYNITKAFQLASMLLKTSVKLAMLHMPLHLLQCLAHLTCLFHIACAPYLHILKIFLGCICCPSKISIFQGLLKALQTAMKLFKVVKFVRHI